MHFTLWQASDPFVSFNNIFVDADNDPTTGYAFNGIGSDMLIQAGVGYQEKAGSFNAGDINGLDWLAAPTGAGTEFELRFSRHATYADPDAGGLVFRTNTIAVVLESENAGYVTVEMAPDAGSGGITHTLLNFTPIDLGTISISRQTNGLALTWSATGKLQGTASLRPINWQDIPNASSPYAVTPAAREQYYRLISP
jgi:hypothetical protein